MKQFSDTSPIVIGGVGGSGTRVVADILMHAGVYLGSNLNQSLDNLLFTVLLKRIDLFEKDEKERISEINAGLDIFTSIMTGKSDWNDIERNNVYTYVRSISKNTDTNHEIIYYFNSRQELIKRILTANSTDTDKYSEWGWKEPNSHILLKYLIQYFNDMKYIHVIRHGLDMAYSNNQNQLKSWGKLYGVRYNEEKHNPVASFQYWLKANQRAINSAKKLLADRFLNVRFDNLCNSPEIEINRIVNFLGITIPQDIFEKIIKIPKILLSNGRYKKYDTSWMTDEDILLLNEIGFDYQS